MPRYHISEKTDRPNICRAKPGNCPLGSEDGEAPHFNTKEETKAHIEEKNAKRYSEVGSTQTKPNSKNHKQESTVPFRDRPVGNSGFFVKDFNYFDDTIKGFSESGLERLKSMSENGEVSISMPEFNEQGKPVKVIGNDAFAHSLGSVTKIESWGNIDTICVGAFEFNKLSSVPESWGNIETIGARAFRYNNIGEIPKVGDNVNVGFQAFEYNKNNLSRNLPEYYRNI